MFKNPPQFDDSVKLSFSYNRKNKCHTSEVIEGWNYKKYQMFIKKEGVYGYKIYYVVWGSVPSDVKEVYIKNETSLEKAKKESENYVLKYIY